MRIKLVATTPCRLLRLRAIGTPIFFDSDQIPPQARSIPVTRAVSGSPLITITSEEVGFVSVMVHFGSTLPVAMGASCWVRAGDAILDLD